MISELRVQRSELNMGDGMVAPVRGDNTGAMMVQYAHGRYQDAVRRGNVFMVTNSAAQALSLNSTTATGIILWNPPNSAKNLVFLEAMIALGSLPAGVALALLTGGSQPAVPTGTATTNVGNGILNALVGFGNKSVASVYSAATLTTAQIQRILPLATAATVAASTSFPPFAKDEISGALIVPPGNAISLQCLTTAITVIGQLTWEEVPI